MRRITLSAAVVLVAALAIVIPHASPAEASGAPWVGWSTIAYNNGNGGALADNPNGNGVLITLSQAWSYIYKVVNGDEIQDGNESDCITWNATYQDFDEVTCASKVSQLFLFSALNKYGSWEMVSEYTNGCFDGVGIGDNVASGACSGEGAWWNCSEADTSSCPNDTQVAKVDS